MKNKKTISIAKITYYVIILFIMMFIVSCSKNKESSPQTEKIQNIVRIFMHEPLNYTVMIQKDSLNECKMITFEQPITKVHFIADVPDSSLSWVIVKQDNHRMLRYKELWFHIHNPEDIEGGGWNHGKGGKGETIVIE